MQRQTPQTDVAEIRKNLIAQLTAPVKWTQSVEHMLTDGAKHIYRSRSGQSIARLGEKKSTKKP
jgi:[acyl-carrier-protein] S-malonyltransferase